MLRSRNGVTAAFMAIALGVSWHFNSNEIAAQSPPCALIVVADASDADCVKQIGGKHVQVKTLFATNSGVLPSNYEACDERVRSLLKFRLFIFRGESRSRSIDFWRERMAAVNPAGKMHRLSQSRSRSVAAWDQRIHDATNIHSALRAILPKHRASLDANLNAELQRLHRLRLQSYQLAGFTGTGKDR